jgi:predicted ATPase with chaperone activity
MAPAAACPANCARARAIAELEEKDDIGPKHVAGAIQYRSRFTP